MNKKQLKEEIIGGIGFIIFFLAILFFGGLFIPC